jgi:hypothetical protein
LRNPVSLLNFVVTPTASREKPGFFEKVRREAVLRFGEEKPYRVSLGVKLL